MVENLNLTDDNHQFTCEVDLHDLHTLVRSNLPNTITMERITLSYKDDPVLQTLLLAVKRGYIKTVVLITLKRYKDVFSLKEN